MTKTTYLEKNNQLNIPTKDGEIQLKKDKEAVEAFFDEHVNKKFIFTHSKDEHLKKLIEGDYIDESIIKKYDYQFILDLFDFIYSYKFRFKTYMGANKFYKQYAMKTGDGKTYLERYEDRIAFNALMMGDGSEKYAKDIAKVMIEQMYQPATPTFLSAGRKHRGEFVSCFLMDIQDDMNSIGRAINSALQLSSRGGGVGINLSNIRALGDPIKTTEGAASGIVPVMKLFEDSFKYANQLGQRQGAGVVYLNVFHPDIIDFLSTRVENAEESKRIKMLSLGVTMPDKFYELARLDKYMRLFSPYDVERVYGKPFSYVDITEEYDNMVQNPNIRKTIIKARDLEEQISRLQQESGYPYILNVDTANRNSPVHGKIIMSNLCSEILQIQEPSVINNAQEYEVLGKDISCNLGSTNIANHIKSGSEFGHTVQTMVRALTFVTDTSYIDAVPTVANGNSQSHTIGLGAMGLHQALAENKIHYGSPESLEFVDAYFTLLNYWTIVESMNIAKEKGMTFHNFDKSTYASGEYFDSYTGGDFEFKFDKIKDIFSKIDIPTQGDWLELKEMVMKHGIYHQNRLAVAP